MTDMAADCNRTHGYHELDWDVNLLGSNELVSLPMLGTTNSFRSR